AVVRHTVMAVMPRNTLESQRCCSARRPLHQRTAALRHVPRLARGDPDDLFRQDHVLECEPRGTPGLGRESAAGMTADAVPTRRAFAEERQAIPDCGSLVRFSRRASCIHWAKGGALRLPSRNWPSE